MLTQLMPDQTDETLVCAMQHCTIGLATWLQLENTHV